MANFIRFGRLFRLYEAIQPYIKFSLHLENELPGEKVLVLAPHQDDEVIGCGGTIIKHIKKGGNASVVYFTSESEQRNKESTDALSILGISNFVNLNYKINSLENQKELDNDIIKVLKENNPDIVFVPFLLDNHKDHISLNKSLLKISKKESFSFMIYSYPVWLPLYPNILTDIGFCWEQKKNALLCYKSQLATRDYVKMCKSISKYWAEVKGHNLDFLETFFRASFNEYVSLGNKIY